MRAINHALTGAVIGLTVSSPAFAVPLAVASHFICDALPHYGASKEASATLRSKTFAASLVIDAGLCFLLVVLLAVMHQSSWLLASVCAFAAAAPDLAWVPGYLRVHRGAAFAEHPNRLMRFAKAIQWFERPSGAIVEIAWFAVFSTIVVSYLA